MLSGAESKGEVESMSTWIEIEAESGRAAGGLAGIGKMPDPQRPEIWRAFDARRGTGSHGFRERLSRARLIYLRRHEAVANWLALVLALIFIGCSSAPRAPEEPLVAQRIAMAPSPTGNSFPAPRTVSRR